ncbi:MAG: 2-C-methyl-D-erythritol 4-phosphate cytidylyltransferase [Erysipelothrix sp.]|nr:2-C-methyl-D-erythritol 4-phosphate cytidylyltransferase [Erysipelothrix sp.]
MDYSCVLVAAGSGSRTGLQYNKVFYKLGDKTVIEHSASNFILDDDCKQVIIVINPKEVEDFKTLNLGSKVMFVNGGERRQDSVYNGLLAVDQDYVMIHDGARPYLGFKTIKEIKKALKSYDACVVMVASIDTTKIVENGIVKKTLNRKTLYNAQTPQAFKTSLIKESYQTLEAENLSVTDDSQAVESTSNKKVFVISGDYRNIKITTKEDLV